MLEAIEKLLVLQDRDRRLMRLKEELLRVPTQRQELETKAALLQKGLDTFKNQAKQVESSRKQLELEVESKKQQIEKYSLQQYQTKKNEEYRALGHEIDNAKVAISKIEDQIIDLMEKGEAVQAEVVHAGKETAMTRKAVDEQIASLNGRETNLKKDLAELESNRSELASHVEAPALGRYERLLKSKGETVVVGIERGVCGGCHMRLNRQVLVTCQAQQEITCCPNCARILYYTRDMDLAFID
jgi:predicted  nucleic acid-binding Zn-ribbon protein